MKRILLASLLGATLFCAASGPAVGQDLRPESGAYPASLAIATNGTELDRVPADPALFTEHAAGWRWGSVGQNAGLPPHPRLDDGKKRFSFRGTLIGAAVGGGLAFAFMTASCEHACWSHPDTPKVFGVGIGFGAAVGLGYDMNRYEREKDVSR